MTSPLLPLPSPPPLSSWEQAQFPHYHHRQPSPASGPAACIPVARCGKDNGNKVGATTWALKHGASTAAAHLVQPVQTAHRSVPFGWNCMSQVSRLRSFADGVGRPPALHIFAQLLQARLSSSWAAGLHPALHCMRQLLHCPDIVAPSSTYRRQSLPSSSATRDLSLHAHLIHYRRRCRGLPGVVAAPSYLTPTCSNVGQRHQGATNTWSFDPQFHHSITQARHRATVP
jgi:hypothetical protein